MVLCQTGDLLIVNACNHAISDFNALIAEEFFLSSWDKHLREASTLDCGFKVTGEVLFFVRDRHCISEQPEDANKTLVVTVIPQNHCVLKEMFLSHDLDDRQRNWKLTTGDLFISIPE